MALLEVENLQTHFRTISGVNRAVDGVSFHIDEGETLAIVGESGCGKSVTANSILRLIPQPPGKIAGSIRFNGVDLLTLSDREIRNYRGKDISMIFQEPMTSLNPVLTVGHQIAESVRIHTGASAAAARARAAEMLRLVKIPDAERRLNDYPHQFSGGMRQRVMIATALACNPTLLIADEPTTALDVTIQAQILDLLLALQAETGMALVLITHSMGVVAETAHRVVVQYAGKQVERQPVQGLFAEPHHPYTVALLDALPDRATGNRLPAIPGVVPGQGDRPTGCLFNPRCGFATDMCRKVAPPIQPAVLGNALCHYPRHSRVEAA